MVCAECMKMCCLGGKNSVVKGLSTLKGVATKILTMTLLNLGGKIMSAFVFSLATNGNMCHHIT